MAGVGLSSAPPRKEEKKPCPVRESPLIQKKETTPYRTRTPLPQQDWEIISPYTALLPVPLEYTSPPVIPEYFVQQEETNGQEGYREREDTKLGKR